MDKSKLSKFQVHYTLEIEMKFFIQDLDRKLTKKLRSLNQHKEITQYFFSLDLSQRLLEELICGHEDNELVSSFNFKKAKARVRQIEHSSDSKSYLIGFKGKKDKKLRKLGVTAKPELEIEISAERYQELKVLADRGSVSKTRVFCPFESNGDSYILELDLIKKLNNQPIEPKYIVGEIELNEDKATQQITDIRKDSLLVQINKNLNLELSEITAGSDEIESKLVSNRKLLTIYAKDGIPNKLQKYFN